MNNSIGLPLKVFAAITYAAMVTVNFSANALPINNRSTGAISDAYPNLFAPAGVTFSIWGLIYLLLGGYLLYQFISFGKDAKQKDEALCQKVNLLFAINALCNIAWIFSWHYDYIGLSVIIMAFLLITLIKINDVIGAVNLSTQEKLFVATPFSVYFGWITVATIANITVFLVSIGWNGFGIADYIWTCVILFIGAAIGVLRMLKDKKLAYGLVLVWAYSGILFKHLSQSGFAGQYVSVITVTIICIIIFTVTLFEIYKKNNIKLN
ncbi:tryptophan-rich sensory protein [Candidatus Falkowbacteria bacterium]|nr:tryptophan-rich sensory protein [Candidatus Falkowbacteria bacterium]